MSRREQYLVGKCTARVLLSTLLLAICTTANALGPAESTATESFSGEPRSDARRIEASRKTGANTAEKSVKKAASQSGKLNAVGRIRKALTAIVEFPLAGAYIGTAGGAAPTAPGLIGGAAIGALYGVASAIHVLVTGKSMGDERSETNSPMGSSVAKSSLASIDGQLSIHKKAQEICGEDKTMAGYQSKDWSFRIPGRYRVDTKFQGVHAAGKVDFKIKHGGTIGGQLGLSKSGNKITDCAISDIDILSCKFVGKDYQISPGNNVARLRFSSYFMRFCGYVFPAGTPQSVESKLKYKITGIRL